MRKPKQSAKYIKPEFWRELAPELTIGCSGGAATEISFDAMLSSVSEVLNRDGYLRLAPQFGEPTLKPVRDALEVLSSAGIPPVYIYLYDQPWTMFAELRQLIGHFLGDNFARLPNFWAWNIPPTEGARGWPPHSDCQARTRFPDGTGGDILLSLSLWIPLCDASLENGCISVLPRSEEHHYEMPLDDPGTIKPEHVTPLPARAGSILGWAQDLYHWSNRVTDKAEGPRLSLSFEFQNRAFEALAKPLLDISKPPPFETRLQLISQQFAKYRHMEAVEFSINGVCDKPVQRG